MAKKRDDWQPMLLDPTGPKPSRDQATDEEPRVEYDRGAKRPENQPFSEEGSDGRGPWWDRAQQKIDAPPEPAGKGGRGAGSEWGRAWRGLLLGEGWTFRLKPARQAELEASVRGVDVRPGVVEAGTAAGRERPHRVQLRLNTLSSAEWARLVRQVVDDGAGDVLARDLAAAVVPLALV